MGEICNLAKMTMFVVLKNQLLLVVEKYVALQRKDIDLNFKKIWQFCW